MRFHYIKKEIDEFYFSNAEAFSITPTLHEYYSLFFDVFKNSGKPSCHESSVTLKITSKDTKIFRVKA